MGAVDQLIRVRDAWRELARARGELVIAQTLGPGRVEATERCIRAARVVLALGEKL